MMTINLRKMIFTASILLGGVFYAGMADAALMPNAGEMIKNLSKAVPELVTLTTAIGYVMGMYLLVVGLLKLKQYGEQRTMMSSQYDLKGPLLCLFAGATLLYLPATLQMATSTFWGNASPLAYVPQSEDAWSTLIKDCFMIIQLVGYVAVIRGLAMFSHLSGHGGHQASFGKAMAHLIGGVLCINMYQLLQTLINTFGLGQI